MTSSTSAVREPTRIVTAHRQREGAGFIVRRPFPTQGMDLADPFLLLDEMGPADYGPGEAVGAPDHPHRGFETITYMLEGEFEHEDSAGHRGVLRPGDVQWMTAGAGIVHSEMPSHGIREKGGRVHGFQIWVNLPAKLKMTRPRYQEVSAGKIPEGVSEDGKARVRVIAGEALGVRAVIDTHIPIVYQDWKIAPGADVTVSLPREQLRIGKSHPGRTSPCRCRASNRRSRTCSRARCGSAARRFATASSRFSVRATPCAFAASKAEAGCYCSPVFRSESPSPATVPSS